MKFSIVGQANLTQMKSEFSKLQAQIDSTNASMAASAGLADGMVSAAAGANMRKQLRSADVAWSDAMRSSRAYRVETVKLSSATDDYTRKLQQQKLGLMDVIKNQGVANKAYKEQLALSQAIVRTSGDGKFHVAVPTTISADLDTANKRLEWYGRQLDSVATQTVNWGKNTQWAGRQLMVGFTIPIAAFGAATGKMAYEVDKELTRIRKVYDTTADMNNTTAEGQMAVQQELAQVTKDAMNTAAGAASEYGANVKETLALQSELAAVGLKGADLQKTTNEVVRIATLGEIDHQTALQSTIALQSVFRMSTDELAESFNYMNAVENATSLTTQDFAQAIPIAAASVRSMGGDVQDLGMMLVAMRERGIQAGEAANAIKALQQRLFRPSKQIQKEFEAITNASIIDIRDRNKGNIVGMLQDLNRETRDLSQVDKTKVFAGLFGSYQVTRMSALVEGMGDLQAGIGQVSDAYAIGEQSAEEWAKTAQREIEAYQQSASGRFKILVEEFKAEAAEMGKPFLRVGAVILEVATTAASFFNALPEGSKNLIALGAITVGVAGPLVMLTGLMANLTGHAMKGAVMLTKLAGSSELLTIRSVAAKASMEQNTVAMTRFTSQATAAASANNILNASLAETAVMARNSTALGKATSDMNKGTKIESTSMLAPLATGANNSEKIKTNMAAGALNAGLFAAAMTASVVSSNQTVDNIANMVMLMTTLGPMVTMAGKGIRALTAGASGGALGRLAGLLGGGGKVGLVGTLGTLARFVGPAGVISAGAYGVYKIYQHQNKVKAEELQRQKDIAAQQEMIRKSAQDFAESTGKAAHDSDRLLLNMVRMGNIESKNQNPYLDESKSIADQLKKLGSLRTQMLAATRDAGTEDLSEAQTDFLKSSFAKGMTMDGATVRSVQEDLAKLLFASGFSDYSADEIARQISLAMTDGAGNVNPDQAIAILSKQVNDSLKNGGLGLNDAVKTEVKTFGDTFALATEEERPKLAAAFDNMLATDYNPDELLANLPKEVRDLAKDLELPIGEVSSVMEKLMKATNFDEYLRTNSTGVGEAGIDKYFDSQGLEDFVKKMEGAGYDLEQIINRIRSIQGVYDGNDNILGDLSKLGNAADAEQKLVEALRERFDITERVTSATELMNSTEFKLMTLGPDAEISRKEVESLIDSLAGLLALRPDLSQAERDMVYLANLNFGRVALGLEETENAVDGLGRGFTRNGTYFDGIESKAEKLKRKLEELKGAFNWGDIHKTGWTAAIEAGADSAMKSFESSMNSSMKAYEAGQNARIDAQNAAFDSQEAAMEKRFARRTAAVEKFFDRRIKANDNLIKTEEKVEKRRKAIFDAEEKRIERLATMQKMSVDFNTALLKGEMDEAANIQLDMDAERSSWELADIEDRMAKRSEKRIEKLQKRNERLENQKDKRLDALKKLEENERAHLQKVQKMRSDALRREVEQNIAGQQAMWDARKSRMDDAIAYFKSYIPKNERDLQKHIKRTKERYGEFGTTIEKMGVRWREQMSNGYEKAIVNAINETRTSINWQDLGDDVATKVMKGLGLNKGQFYDLMKTGKWPSKKNSGEDRHEGGLVGSGTGGSRKGVARQYPGVHQSERMIRAQDGEYFVNRNDSKKNLRLLAHINSGGDPADFYRTGIGGNNNVGMAMGGTLQTVAGAVALPGYRKALTYVAERKQKRAKRTALKKGLFNGLLAGMKKGNMAYPSMRGRGWNTNHDYANPNGSPLYAFANGTVIQSRAITSGGSPGNGLYDIPYRSYGEMMQIRANNGSTLMYGHMYPNSRKFKVGQKVKAGQVIGLSGNTGNSTGPHTHFEVNGRQTGAQQDLAALGIPLRKGAANINYDNTIANLHKDEAVLTKDLNAKFKRGVDNFEKGGNNEYNINLEVSGVGANMEEITKAVVKAIRLVEDRKPHGRKND